MFYINGHAHKHTHREKTWSTCSDIAIMSKAIHKIGLLNKIQMITLSINQGIYNGKCWLKIGRNDIWSFHMRCTQYSLRQPEYFYMWCSVIDARYILTMLRKIGNRQVYSRKEYGEVLEGCVFCSHCCW